MSDIPMQTPQTSASTPTNRQRLEQIARERPTAVLGVLAYWLGPANNSEKKD
jgi:hypothetical protein